MSRSLGVLVSFASLTMAMVTLVPAAAAATKTTTFTVQAQVTADCTVAATTMNFGSLGLLTASVDAASTLTATCTNTTPYSIGLDAGTVSGSTIPLRLLDSAGATVNFQLYQDTGRSSVWGLTAGTDVLSATGTGAAQVHTVYGRVPAQAAPAPGTYTTTINVTVTY